MRSKLFYFNVFVAATVAASGATEIRAGIVETNASSNSETGFDAGILTNDLIENGSATVTSMTATAGANFPASGASDGTAAHTNGLVYYGGPPSTGVDLTYLLNTNPGTGGSARGFDISSINAIYGWTDSRYRHAAQEWQLYVGYGGGATTNLVDTVVYTPFAANDDAAGSSQVTLTNLNLSNVTSIDFHLTPYGSPGDPGYTGEIGVVREFDVLGTPTVPEPTSIVALGSLGLMGLFFAIRHRKA